MKQVFGNGDQYLWVNDKNVIFQMSNRVKKPANSLEVPVVSQYPIEVLRSRETAGLAVLDAAIGEKHYVILFQNFTVAHFGSLSETDDYNAISPESIKPLPNCSMIGASSTFSIAVTRDNPNIMYIWMIKSPTKIRDIRAADANIMVKWSNVVAERLQMFEIELTQPIIQVKSSPSFRVFVLNGETIFEISRLDSTIMIAVLPECRMIDCKQVISFAPGDEQVYALMKVCYINLFIA